MWFNDELVEKDGWGFGRRGNRRRTVLELNARLRENRSRWVTRIVGVVVFLVATAAVAALGRMGLIEMEQVIFSENPDYVITNIALSCQGSEELKRYVGAKVHAWAGTNLFAVDMRLMHEDIASIPHVKSVFIRRRLPETLEVQVKERLSVARLGNPVDETRNLLVDDEGRLFTASSEASRVQARLRPVIRGYSGDMHSPGDRLHRELADSLAFLDVWMTRDAGRGLLVDEVTVAGKEMQVRLKGGTVVCMPGNSAGGDIESYKTGIENRMAYLQVVLKKADAADRPVTTLNLVPDDYTKTCYGTPRWDRKD